MTWFDDFKNAASINDARKILAPAPINSHPNQGGMSGDIYPYLNQNCTWSCDMQILQSNDPTCLPAYCDLSGTLTVGNTIGLRLFYNNSNHDYDHVVQSGDTILSVCNAIIALINADSAGRALGMFSQIGGPAQVLVNPPYNHIPVISSHNSGGATASWSIQQSNGKLDGNPYHGLARIIPGYSGRAGDLLGSYSSYGQDSGGNIQQYGIIINSVVSPTAGAAEGKWAFETPNGCFASGNGMILYSQGSGAVSPAGGYKGVGTINTPVGYYLNGQPVAVMGHQRLPSTAAYNNNFVERAAYNIGGIGISSWATIMTITPDVVSGRICRGIIEAEVMGDTGAVGTGTRKSRWQYAINGGSPTVSLIGTDITANSPPQFRLSMSGNSVLVQVQSNDGTHTIDSGMAAIAAYLPSASGGVINYAIT